MIPWHCGDYRDIGSDGDGLHSMVNVCRTRACGVPSLDYEPPCAWSGSERPMCPGQTETMSSGGPQHKDVDTSEARLHLPDVQALESDHKMAVKI